MNPAALNGDFANALVASTPGGIERQEAQGQRDLARTADKLPSDMRADAKAALESLGFVFGDPVDGIFLSVKMPAGWAIKPTEHSMHSDLVDPHGNRRGGIFYKAAFYDRRAHLHLCCRYLATQDYEKPVKTYFIQDTKTGSRIHVAGAVEYEAWAEGDKLEKQAREWLESNFPDYRNPIAYWND